MSSFHLCVQAVSSMYSNFFFFFSSRRRHTRCSRDWSSDVCSSDLFYDNEVLDVAAHLRPSARGEFEITDVNQEYLRRGALHVTVLGRGIAWLDTGTPEALLQAANYVAALEERQGLKVGAIEEVAYRMGVIDAAQVERLAAPLMGNPYADYLRAII